MATQTTYYKFIFLFKTEELHCTGLSNDNEYSYLQLQSLSDNNNNSKQPQQQDQIYYISESEDLDEYYKRKVHEFPSHPLILNKYAEYLQILIFGFDFELEEETMETYFNIEYYIIRILKIYIELKLLY
ncbi:hypothetical protein P8452_20630 [Trifolium repens]|nr:hypothetical protein P8452_20630 [Trifolium repens]